MIARPNSVGTFENSPGILHRLIKSGTYLSKFHILFIVSWAATGVVYSPLAEWVAKLGMPFYALFVIINPNVNRLFTGELSPEFYKYIASETFGMGMLCAGFLVLPYVARYSKEPTGLASFIAQRLKCKELSIPIFGLFAASVGIMWALSFIFPYWFGFIPYPPTELSGPIKLHQLALWSIIAGITPTILAFLFFCLMSYLLLLMRMIYSTFVN